MRAFGVTLVTLALVLGAGGVARRPLAETSSGTPPALTDHAEIGTCKPSPPPRAVEIDTSHAPKDFVSLNTRGYNYRQPGDPPQIIPDSTGKQRPESVQP